MKAIIFDIDNTLIEWQDNFFNAIVKTLKEDGHDYSLEKVHKIFDTIDENEEVKERLEMKVLLKQ